MDKSLIPALAEVLELYYDHEITELASIFGVNWTGEIFAGNQFRWLPVARQLVEQIDRGNHYVMLESLFDAIEQRNKTAIARQNLNSVHGRANRSVYALVATPPSGLRS
jgi:hypothetical protein